MSSAEFLRSVDPSPLVEQELLMRVKKQLQLGPSYNKLDTEMSKVCVHLKGLRDAFAALTSEFSVMPINRGVVELLRQFGALFDVISKAVSDQCSMNVQAFTKVLLPALNKNLNDFKKASSACNAELDLYCQLTDRSKPEEVQAREDALEAVMCNRAAHFSAMSNFTKRSEGTVTNGIGLVLASVMKVFAGELADFVGKNKMLFDNAMKQDTNESLKGGFQPESGDLTKNEGYQNAKLFWDVRRKRAQPTERTSVPSGILWIRGRKLWTSWTRKFGMFMDGALNLYDPVTGAREQSVRMDLVTTGQVTKKKRRFCFKIQDETNHFQLEALTQFDMNLWFEVLTKHNMRVLAPEPAQDSGDQVAVSDTPCADCGCSQATWCSLNWATMLCLNCSGVHRQMSVNTSKVRSMQLDKLHPFIQDMLNLLSNAANDLLLEKSPPIDVTPRMDEPVRRDFITRKYQTREWATRNPVPDPFEAILKRDYMSLFWACNFGRGEEKYDSMTVLQAAVESGSETLVTIAACCTNDIDATDSNGWTALTYALVYGFTEIGKFLISMGARADHSKVDMRVLACFLRDKDIINHVMEFTSASRPCLEFRPKSTKFATGSHASFTELVIVKGKDGSWSSKHSTA